MITCTLGGKRYSVDFISGRALREMGPAWDMYARLSAVAADAVAGKSSKAVKDSETPSVTTALDVMVKWFCLLFGNQFSPDDVYDHYPVDRLMHDVVLALLAVQTQTTDVLSEFPYSGSAGSNGILTLQDYIYATYNELLSAGWRMSDIDRMDMLGFFRVRAWDANRANAAKTPKRRYIDEVWPESR